MPTIKDIAAEAGVSCGTVSNVLNKKGNVRAEKIQLVQEAINRLSYSINESAKVLRQNKRNTIGLLVPDMRSRHYITLYESISSLLRPYDYTVEIYSTSNLYQHEKDFIQKMVSANVNCIVSFPTYIHSDEIYDKIPASIYLVLIGPRPTNVARAYLSMSFDYEGIGADIAAYVIGKGYKTAALLLDSVRFSESFSKTIRHRLQKAGVSVRTFGSTCRNAVVRAFDPISQPEEYDAIITSNLLRARAVKQTYNLLHPNAIPEIITLSSTNTIFEDEYTSVYLDYAKLGMQLAESLIQRLVDQKEVNDTVLFYSEGLNRHVLNIPLFSVSRPLKILASDSYCSHSLQKLLPNFTAKSGVEVNLSFYPPADFERVVARVSQPGSCDLLISDANYFQTTCQSLYIRKADYSALWRELHDNIDVSATYFPWIAENNLSFSLNTSCQMLFYRNDRMNDQSFRRLFYESSYRELDVPRSVRDFDDIARFFSRALNPSSPIACGASVSSVNSDCFLDELYWRMAASENVPKKPDGRLDFMDAGFIAVLREHFRALAASGAVSPQASRNAIEDFIRGDALLSIFSTSNAYMFNANEYSAISDCVKCGDVPGMKPVVNYDVIGIVRSSNATKEAAAFLKWLYHDYTSNILTLISGQPILKSSTTNSEILGLYPWLKHFNRSIECATLLSEALSPLLYHRAFRSELMMAIANSYNQPASLEEAFRHVQEFYDHLLL